MCLPFRANAHNSSLYVVLCLCAVLTVTGDKPFDNLLPTT